MNPILIYPNTEAQFKICRDLAAKQGMPMARISSTVLEEIEDGLFFERMIAAETGTIVSEDEYKQALTRKLAGK